MRQNLLLFLFSCLSSIIWGQVPQGIPYQAVARDAQGNPMSNQSLTVQFSLHEASADGQVVYQETQTTTTNGQGLFSLTFGAGVPSVGTFANINWGSGYKFLQVQANFGNGYVDLGTQQLMSVPYALYSGSSGNGSNGQNSNYNPSADSVLTLIGKISLYPGTYTIPQNEVWELEAINVIGALPTLTGSYSFCETYQYNANMIKCYYSFAQSEIPLFTLDSWSFQASVAFNYQYLPRTDFFTFESSTAYSCDVCPPTKDKEISVGVSAFSNLNLPIYASSGQQLFIQNGYRVSVSKYK